MSEFTIPGLPCGEPLDQHVVFVAVDTEFRDDNMTEIGFAALDTASIESMHPGWRGTAWFPLIASSHFVVDEAEVLRSARLYREYNFGTSRYVKTADLRRYIRAKFEEWQRADRCVVLVGQGLKFDLVMAQVNLGIDLTTLPAVTGLMDTDEMRWQLPGAEVLSGGGLRKLYQSLSRRTGHSFHNAGNDAVYALRATILLAATQAIDGAAVDRTSPKFRSIYSRSPDEPEPVLEPAAGHSETMEACRAQRPGAGYL